MLFLGSMLGGASNWAWAVLGIGLVIFVHELGHFLVAKKCGVRCEIFSLGFGPRLLGIRRGDTDYRLSLVPIGGYVKMAGDNPGEELEGDEGELPSKSVGQRFAIFSAGVVMNLLFAFIALPIVLSVGVRFHSTVVGGVDLGSPAWEAGLQAGDEIISIDGETVYDYNDVVAQIALGEAGGVQLKYRRDAEDTVVKVVPVMNEDLGFYEAGLRPSVERTFAPADDGAAAEGGIRADQIVTSVDGVPIDSFTEFNSIRAENEAATVTLGLLNPDGTSSKATIRPRAAPPIHLVGISAYANHIRTLRGPVDAQPDFLRADDKVLGLSLRDSSAEHTEPALTMPIRDPQELAEAFQAAGDSSLTGWLTLDRPGAEAPIEVALPANFHPEWARDIALVQDQKSLRIRLMDGYPAQKAGLPEDCLVLKVNGNMVEDWDALRGIISQAGAEPVTLLVDSQGQKQQFRIVPQVVVRLTDFGLLPVRAMVERRFGIVEATRVGVAKAIFMLKNVYLTLKKMFARRVSPKNLSGILTIAVVSKSLAESGIPSLFFFLSILSLNLAFINILPIPILDGGHLMFLLIEKIKGSPVSERVMGYSQLVGLVMVLALILYVTYNDLIRILSP